MIIRNWFIEMSQKSGQKTIVALWKKRTQPSYTIKEYHPNLKLLIKQSRTHDGNMTFLFVSYINTKKVALDLCGTMTEPIIFF